MTMGTRNALTAGIPRNTSLYVIAALTMAEALIFGILFGITLDEIDDDRSIRGSQEKILKTAGGIIIGTYVIAFLLSIGLMFGAAKKYPGCLKVFFVFGVVKCILKVAVAAIFINSGILTAACVLVIICAVLNTYLIAIVAATEKEMRKLLNSPVATAPAATANPQRFVGSQGGMQPPYNPGLGTYDNNNYPAPPSYGELSEPPPSYYAESETSNFPKK